jgi:hypothetical protein
MHAPKNDGSVSVPDYAARHAASELALAAWTTPFGMIRHSA